MKKKHLWVALPLLLVAAGIFVYRQVNQATVRSQGYNADLPAAHFAREGLPDKLSSYKDAMADSSALPLSFAHFSSFDTPATKKLYEKLADLDRIIAEPPHPFKQPVSLPRRAPVAEESPGPAVAPDTELVQLDHMMDKILDVQHPQRVQERLRAAAAERKKGVYAVTSAPGQDGISLLESKPTSTRPACVFYPLDTPDTPVTANAIEAVVHGTQTVTDGAVLQLRLQAAIVVPGQVIPAGTLLSGIASIRGERLLIVVTTIRYQDNILPVVLRVYDLDGIAGLFIPGLLSRDVAKQSTNQSVQSFGPAMPSSTVGGEAINAGIATAKTWLSKKAKLVRVTVKGNYRVLLYDEKNKEE